VALAVWLGAVTHALWDGFTHRYRWPASELYPNGPLAMWLQHGSSVVGSLVVLGALARRYPHLPEAPGGRWRDFLPVLLPAVVLGAVVLGLRLARAPVLGSLEAQLRWTVWHVVDGVLAGLTLGCVLARLRARRRTG
jgi:hypothetical protein